MVKRWVRGPGALAAAAALAVVLGASPRAEAQWGYYPGGYGGYGWGGWGGETVQGSMARGLGVYAAGAGVYNQQTAVARSINADTVMRWNEYWYNSQLEANRNERARQLRRQGRVNETLSQNETRLRENPTQRDIESGNALNVAAEQINDPRVYTKALQSAKVPIGGETIRNIPFQYAAAAISTSVHDLTQNGAPPLLRTPEFEADRAEMRSIAAEIRADTEEGKTPDPAKLRRAEAKLGQIREKFEANVKRNSPGYAEADRFLRAALGLVRMLETPAVDVLLAGVEKRPDATLAELLNFMNAFNLRFGAATTPRQREIYASLYQKLDKVRDEVTAGLTPATAKADPSTAGEFFAGMAPEDIAKKPRPPAAQPPK